MPIMSHVLIEKEKNKILITGTNLEVQITSAVNFKEADDFELAFGREIEVPKSCASGTTTPATDPAESKRTAVALFTVQSLRLSCQISILSKFYCRGCTKSAVEQHSKPDTAHTI